MRDATRNAFAASVVLLAMATLAWLLDGLGRGLELTDESFYLLSALHPHDVRLFFTPFHWVTGLLWRASGSLVAFRAWGLALNCFGAIALAWAVLTAAPVAGMNAPVGRFAQAAVLASATSGALLYGSLLSFTPSYNLLAAGGASFSVAFGLLAACSMGRSRTFELLAGAAIGLTFLCKFSAGICVGGLVVILHAAFASHRPRGWRRLPLLAVACAIAAAVSFAALETGFTEALRQFRAGIDIVWFAQGDGSTLRRLLRSASDVAGMLSGAAVVFWGPLACMAIGLRWRTALPGLVGLAWFAILLATGRGHLAGGQSQFEQQAMPLAALLAFALLAGAAQWTRTWRAALLTAALTALPVAVALGTSNPLQVQILGAMASWGALVGLLGFQDSARRVQATLIAVLFCTVVLVQVLTGRAEPYRILPMALQTERVTLPSLGMVMVDARTAAMARDLQAAARTCALPQGVPFLDFYDLPGAALMIGAAPVETPWLLHKEYASLALRHADPGVLRRAVVALKLEDAGKRPDPPAQLAGFPQGYKPCGHAVTPLDGRAVELWAPT
jgi:hypothetical protein